MHGPSRATTREISSRLRRADTRTVSSRLRRVDTRAVSSRLRRADTRAVSSRLRRSVSSRLRPQASHANPASGADDRRYYPSTDAPSGVVRARYSLCMRSQMSIITYTE